MPTFGGLASLVFVLSVFGSAQTPKKAVPSSVQYKIYNAVLALMRFPKEPSWRVGTSGAPYGYGDSVNVQ